MYRYHNIRWYGYAGVGLATGIQYGFSQLASIVGL